jgi:hypothetical protein
MYVKIDSSNNRYRQTPETKNANVRRKLHRFGMAEQSTLSTCLTRLISRRELGFDALVFLDGRVARNRGRMNQRINQGTRRIKRYSLETIM